MADEKVRVMDGVILCDGRSEDQSENLSDGLSGGWSGGRSSGWIGG